MDYQKLSVEQIKEAVQDILYNDWAPFIVEEYLGEGSNYPIPKREGSAREAISRLEYGLLRNSFFYPSKRKKNNSRSWRSG